MAEKEIKVLLVDDHQIILDGLQRLLADTPGIHCVASASNGSDALYRLQHLDVDVVLSDLDMPEMNGLELLARMRDERITAKVIILTMHDEAAVIQRVIDAGADGYLIKNSGKDDLLQAIKRVYAGERYFSSKVTESLLNQQTKTTAKDTLLSELTERELEVLTGVAEGLSNKEIGEKLFISPRTVDTHRTNLMKKLSVNNIAGLVRIAMRSGLIE